MADDDPIDVDRFRRLVPSHPETVEQIDVSSAGESREELLLDIDVENALVPGELFPGETVRVMDWVDGGKGFVTSDDFDPRLDEVVALFRTQYPLPVIVECGWSDEKSRPEAQFFVFDAPVPRIGGSKAEEKIDDCLVACVRKIERTVQCRVIERVAPAWVTFEPWSPEFAFERTFVPAVESPFFMQRLLRAEAGGETILRKYGRCVLSDPPDAERKRLMWNVGPCNVTVGRNEEGGYYTFVRCETCGWTSGAVYVATRPEENTPETAKVRGVAIAEEHSFTHPRTGGAF